MKSQINVDIEITGLNEKLDMINRAIDLFRQAEAILARARQISVDVVLGDHLQDDEA